MLFQLLYLNSPLWGDDHLRYIRAIQDGKVLYKDMESVHFPAAWYLFAFITQLFGKDLVVLKLASFTINALAAVLIYGIARQVVKRWQAILCAFLYIIIGTALMMVPSINMEIPFSMVMALAILVFFRFINDRRYGYLVLSGILFGMAFLFKQNIGGLSVIGVCLYLLAENWLTPRREWLKKEIIFVLSLCPIPLITILFFWSSGGLPDFLDQAVFGLKRYYANVAEYPHTFAILWLFITILVVGIIYSIVKSKNHKVLFLSILGFLLCFGSYPMYGEMRLPPVLMLALIVGFYLANKLSLVRMLRGRTSQKLAAYLLILLFLLNLPVIIFNMTLVIYSDINLAFSRAIYSPDPLLLEDIKSLGQTPVYIYPLEVMGVWLYYTSTMNLLKPSVFWLHMRTPAAQENVISYLKADNSYILYQTNLFYDKPSRGELTLLNDYIDSNYVMVKEYNTSSFAYYKPFAKWIKTNLPFLSALAPNTFDTSNSERIYNYVLLKPKDG